MTMDGFLGFPGDAAFQDPRDVKDVIKATPTRSTCYRLEEDGSPLSAGAYIIGYRAGASAAHVHQSISGDPFVEVPETTLGTSKIRLRSVLELRSSFGDISVPTKTYNTSNFMRDASACEIRCTHPQNPNSDLGCSPLSLS